MHADVKLWLMILLGCMPAVLLLVVPLVQAHRKQALRRLHDGGEKFTNAALEEGCVNEVEHVEKYPAGSIVAFAPCGDFAQKTTS